jgi:hypothetical protein
MSNERNESLTAKLANTPTGRRSFLRNSGIAALMAAGAMTVQGGTAAAQTKEAPIIAQETGEIPEGARLTLRLMRSLTLYNMAFLHSSDNDRALIKEIAIKQINEQFGQLAGSGGSEVSYTPNPDDPDPWPWPWWWGRRDSLDLGDIIKWGEIPFDAQLTIRSFEALSVYNQSFLHKGDRQLKLQGVALGQLERLVRKLGSAGGGIAAWEEGDDLCPKWWPWPWPPRRRMGDPEPEPNLESALDLAGSIVNFTIGSAFPDGGAWSDLQRTSFDDMNQQLGQLTSTMKTMSATRSGLIVPGDDFCGTPWPWPHHGDPRRFLDQFGPRPHPWRTIDEAAKITTGMVRSLTLFATAAVFQDIRAGEALQSLAVEQLGGQLEQLGKQIG